MSQIGEGGWCKCDGGMTKKMWKDERVGVDPGCVGKKVSGGLEDVVAVQGVINGERGMGDRYS